MKSVPSDKATAGEIPADILKNSEFCFNELTKCINKAFNESKFPDTLKLSDIVPVFKKLDPSDKTYFRPVSPLPFNLMSMRRQHALNAACTFQTSSEMTERVRLV